MPSTAFHFDVIHPQGRDKVAAVFVLVACKSSVTSTIWHTIKMLSVAHNYAVKLAPVYWSHNAFPFLKKFNNARNGWT